MSWKINGGSNPNYEIKEIDESNAKVAERL